MSVRRVQCPACGAQANILATMTDIKCPSCGVVWNVNNPGAVKASNRPKQQPSENEKATSDKAALVAVIGGAAMFLVVGIVGMMVTLGGKDDQPVTDAEGVEVAEDHSTDKESLPIEYKVVKKLSEETRRKLFFEYRQMAGSTIDKKLKIPKKSAARKAVDGMMKTMANREVTHFSLLYNITEEEVMEVVKEGTAKDW